MVEENKIADFATIFIRQKTEKENVEEFIPVKVVAGYYYKEAQCFVDTEQNVYQHIADSIDFGNVYGFRYNALEIIGDNPKASINAIKKKLLSSVKKYQYYKNNDESSNDYGVIVMVKKRGKDVLLYDDIDLDAYYKLTQNEEAEVLPSEEETTNKNLKEINNSKPDEIIDEIKKSIKGQDEAIEKIVTLLWMKYKFPELGKPNMMVIGPSGVGKTAIFEKIKSLLSDVTISLYNLPDAYQVSLKGYDADEILAKLYQDSGEDIDKTQNGIIILDRFDRLSKNCENKEIINSTVQNEILKLIEGGERTVQLDMFNSVTIDTSNITFIACGDFSDIIEKNPTIGFGSELARRDQTNITIDNGIITNKGGIIGELSKKLPFVIKLNDLTKDNLADILLNSEDSEFMKAVNILSSKGIVIDNMEAIVEKLINDTLAKKAGAHGLYSQAKLIFLKVFKAIGDNSERYERIILGNNIPEDNNDFELVPKSKKYIRKMIRS